MKNRLGLIFLGDRHTAVGRGVGVWRQRRRSSADDAEPHRLQRHRSAPTASASPTSPSDAATAERNGCDRRTTSPSSTSSGSDPSSDLKKLATVATSTQLNAVQTLVGRQQRSGPAPDRHDTRISELKVQSVNLDNSDPTAGKVPTVVIDVCWDVSKVDVLDKSGKSIVSPDRPDTGWTRYTVANYDYAADPTGGWRVATGQDLKQTPCAAS